MSVLLAPGGCAVWCLVEDGEIDASCAWIEEGVVWVGDVELAFYRDGFVGEGRGVGLRDGREVLMPLVLGWLILFLADWFCCISLLVASGAAVRSKLVASCGCDARDGMVAIVVLSLGGLRPGQEP